MVAWIFGELSRLRMQLDATQSEHLVSVTTIHIIWHPCLQFSKVLYQRLLKMLDYESGSGRMESTQKARSRIICHFFSRERSLQVPYKIICCLIYFLRGWEKRPMSSKAAALAGDTSVQTSPDLCSDWGSFVHWRKTGYPKLQPLPCYCQQSPTLWATCHLPRGIGNTTAGLRIGSTKAAIRASNTWILVLNTYKMVNEDFFVLFFKNNS